jgi:hypothetical protein
VNRLSMLVTPDGQWVFPDSSEFLAALGDPNPDYDAEAFAVKNLGFIKFSVIERTIVEVELHPHNAELAALLAVQQQIQTSGVNLFRIRYFDTAWRSEITSSAEQAIARLSELCAPEFIAPLKDKYVVEPRDYGQLLNDESNPLRFMAQKWRTSFGRFDTTVISFAINHHLLSQLLIMGIKPKPADPVFRFVGEAHASWLDRKYHLSVIGERAVNVPDKDYAGWAVEFYKNVASTGKPLFDCVTASIESRSKPYFTRYERLVLPWKTASDEILVTVSPRKLPDAAIPVPAMSSSGDKLALRKSARSS